MLGEIFYWVLNMSIASLITGLIIMLIRSFKKLPRRFVLYLWIIPFLRMIIPAAISGKYNLMSVISGITTRTIPVEGGPIDMSMMNHVMAADTYFPITYRTNLLEDIFDIASIIWAIIGIAVLLTLGYVYLITQRELKDMVKLKDNIWISDKITSPAVYGIFKSKIVIPVGYEKEDLTYVLAHENAHIRHKDNLWRIVAFIITAFHWFNPFAWAFLKAFLSDMELACDERVLRKYGETKKKAYAAALVNSIEHKNVFVSAFGGARIRTRIENILSYKKISVFSTICFCGLFIIIAYALLTNATH